MNTNLELFLKELTEICGKYDMEIYGCGCCGSPIVEQNMGKQRLDHERLGVITNEDGSKIYTVDEQKIEF